MAIRPGDDAPALGVVLGGGDGSGAVRRVVGGDRKLIAVDGDANAGIVRGKGVVGQDVVGVGQGSGILCAVPGQFNVLRSVCAAGKKAGQLGVGLNAGNDTVVVAHDLAAQRVIGTDLVKDCGITAGVDLVEIGVTLTNHRFPNQKLCRHGVGQLIRVLAFLSAPTCRDCSRVAILHDASDQQLNVIGRDRFVVAGRVVVPKALIPLGQLVADIEGNAGFDAVANRPVIGSHGAHDGLAGRAG